MSMMSLQFIALVAGTFFVLWLLGICSKDKKPDSKKTICVLLAASFLSVLRIDFRFAIALALLSAVTWFCGKNVRYRKLGIVIALAFLGYFKYADFFVSSFETLLGQNRWGSLKILLPIGISFYTFSAISYLADVSRGVLTAKSLPEVTLYLAFFPKLTAGPIERSKDFFCQMENPQRVGWSTFSAGIQIYTVGIFKKLVLADRLGIFVDQVYGTPLAFDSLTVLLAVLAYSLQIYFDFSGYSDMAIGVARILGISLPKNFDLPYLSHNVTEFWKRWHISLSSWLRDYLYIPLGGNRKGRVRTCINLMITMVLGGIWHGASWNYAVWGALHGAALIIHKYWAEFTGSKTKEHGFVSNLCSTAVTFTFVSITWVFFRTSSVEAALQIIGRIFSFANGVRQVYTWFFFAFAVLLVSSGVSAFCCRKRKLKADGRNQSRAVAMTPYLDLTKVWNLTLFFCFCGLILGLANTGGSPFIYGKY